MLAGKNYIDNSKIDLAGKFFLIQFLVLVTFATANISRTVDVLHINANKIVVLIGISLLFTLISILRKFRINRITISLIISASLGVLPLIYSSNTESYWGNYLPLLISVFSFHISLQSKGDYAEKIYKIITFILLIISIQVISTELMYFSTLSIGNLNDVSAKGAMNIPIGSSNLIAAFMLPMIVFILSYKRTKVALFISLFSSFILIFTRSKNAIGLALILLLLVYVAKSFKFIIFDRKATQGVKIIAVIVNLIILSFLLYGVAQILEHTVDSLQFAYSSPYSNSFLNYLDRISSGRIAVYHYELARGSQHFWFGNGFGYLLGQSRSHNWIIELFVQKGVVGLIIYLFSITTVFKVGLKYYNIDAFVKASINLLAVIFIQGLFEVSVFTIGIDFFIWSISGLLLARIIYLNNNIDEMMNAKNNLKQKNARKKIKFKRIKFVLK